MTELKGSILKDSPGMFALRNVSNIQIAYFRCYNQKTGQEAFRPAIVNSGMIYKESSLVPGDKFDLVPYLDDDKPVPGNPKIAVEAINQAVFDFYYLVTLSGEKAYKLEVSKVKARREESLASIVHDLIKFVLNEPDDSVKREVLKNHLKTLSPLLQQESATVVACSLLKTPCKTADLLEISSSGRHETKLYTCRYRCDLKEHQNNHCTLQYPDGCHPDAHTCGCAAHEEPLDVLSDYCGQHCVFTGGGACDKPSKHAGKHHCGVCNKEW